MGCELCVKSSVLYLCEKSASQEGNPPLGSEFLTWFFRCMKGENQSLSLNPLMRHPEADPANPDRYVVVVYLGILLTIKALRERLNEA